MMDRIYTEAESVIVWLGEAEATDELALELLKTVHAKNIPLLPRARQVSECDAYLASNVPQKHFNAMAAFLLRPWFSRVWMYVSHEARDLRTVGSLH